MVRKLDRFLFKTRLFVKDPEVCKFGHSNYLYEKDCNTFNIDWLFNSNECAGIRKNSKSFF